MLRTYFRASHILVKALSLRASPKTIFFPSVSLYKFNLVIFFLIMLRNVIFLLKIKTFSYNIFRSQSPLPSSPSRSSPPSNSVPLFCLSLENKQEIKTLARTEFLKIKHEKHIHTCNATPPKKTPQHWKHNIQVKDWQGEKCPSKAI